MGEIPNDSITSLQIQVRSLTAEVERANKKWMEAEQDLANMVCENAELASRLGEGCKCGRDA